MSTPGPRRYCRSCGRYHRDLTGVCPRCAPLDRGQAPRPIWNNQDDCPTCGSTLAEREDARLRAED